MKKIIYINLFVFFGILNTEAQTKKNPFVVNLSEDGKTYIKFGLNTQIWGRYTELNDASRIGTNEVNETYDLVIRRLRLQAMGMLTEKLFFHIQLGQNNVNFTQNSGPSNAPLSIFDLLGEYHFDKKLHVGGGLTGWGAGTTRYSAQSSSSQLTLDAPIYQQNNISSTYGNRNLSVYAKGILNKFTYRVAITNPYQSTTNNLNLNSTISTETPRAQYLGIATYSFLDVESNTEPYNKATYLGTKKVFNVGLGYMTQAHAMWRTNENDASILEHDDMKVLGLDVFYDAPLSNNGNAITLYAAYNNCNYGKNYIQPIATPNPAIKNNSALNGSGNGFIGIGTGNIYYAQVGYLFGKRISNDEKKVEKGRFQAYAATEIASLEALKTPMTMHELGFNYYLTGTFGPKVSLGYQNRALFENKINETKAVQIDRKGMLVLQLQVSF